MSMDPKTMAIEQLIWAVSYGFRPAQICRSVRVNPPHMCTLKDALNALEVRAMEMQEIERIGV